MSQPVYSPRLGEAISWAAHSFRFEVRKGSGVPYLTHLLAVTALVGECGGSEDEMIAAVLHDIVEDINGIGVSDIEARFGPKVAGWVEMLSDAHSKPKPPWQARKDRYLERMRKAPPEVKRIALCDKLHNASTLLRDLRVVGPAMWTRFTTGKSGTLWYYAAMEEALSEGWSHPWLADYGSVVAQLQDLAEED